MPSEPITPSQGETVEVFNPYSDLDKFRRDAFWRIPGAVNIAESEIETLLRCEGWEGPLDTESDDASI